jgi:membrane associated rhomboid family serine protease
MYSGYDSYRFVLGGRLTPGVKALLIATGGVYLLQLIIGQKMIYFLGMNSALILRYGMIWQFFTYMFLHGGFFHIFFNMFILWIFGCEVEREWGTREFLRYYFLTGIGAGLIGFLFSLGTHTIIIGASGAVYGIMLAFAMIYPERIITLLILFVLPVSMKAKHLVVLLALISIFSGISNLFGTGDGVAHFAHLGGMLVGYLYLKSDWRVQAFFRRLKVPGVRRRSRMRVVYRVEDEEELQRQVDAILDKINRVGYDNLTRDEKKLLKKASDYLARKSESD